MSRFQSAQRMEGAKKRIFGIFEGFLALYAPQKRLFLGTSLDFAAFFGQRKIMQKSMICGTVYGTVYGMFLRCPKKAAKFN